MNSKALIDDVAVFAPTHARAKHLENELAVIDEARHRRAEQAQAHQPHDDMPREAEQQVFVQFQHAAHESRLAPHRLDGGPSVRIHVQPPAFAVEQYFGSDGAVRLLAVKPPRQRLRTGMLPLHLLQQKFVSLALAVGCHTHRVNLRREKQQRAGNGNQQNERAADQPQPAVNGKNLFVG